MSSTMVGGSNTDKTLLRISLLLSGMFLLACGFAIAPMGLTGTYLPFGNYVKPGKVGHGVSWSKNLELELQMRKTLCHLVPENILYQFRYDNSTQTCYKVGERGPCGENMVFFGYQTNAVYGQCDCNYNDNSRALIYDEDTNKCHFVYSKGYCQENEWLAFTGDWKPICEPNQCLEHYDHLNKVIPDKKSQKSVSIEFIPYNETCVPLGDTCEERDPQWGSLAHLPHEVQFVKGKLNPRCAPTEHTAWRYPTPKLQCLPGGILTHRALRSENPSEKCHLLFEI